jgi:hypothetical protein
LADVSTAFNYVIVVFLLQISVFFIKQWYDERKKDLINVIILSYGLYFLFFAIGSGIYFYISTNILPNESFFFILSIIIRGIGGVIFAFVMETKFQQRIKTRYILTINYLGVLIVLPVLFNTALFNPLFNINRILTVLLPIIFTIFFIRETFGGVRRKLIIASIGLILLWGGVLFSSWNVLDIVLSSYTYPYFILFPTKVVAIAGLFLIIYGFHGYSFFLELEWRQNLISLDIIEKAKNKRIYHKAFLEDEAVDEMIFAGGIAGIERFIAEFSESKQELGEVSLEDKLILLAQGEKIITTMIVKKKLQHASYVLNEINKKIEVYFWDYLNYHKFYDVMLKESDIFEPMEILIRSIIQM